MRPYIIMVCLTLFCCSGRVAGQTINEQVVSALEKNDHGVLVSCFHTMVYLQIPGYSGNFSQSQASVIVKRFLADHPVGSVSIAREGDRTDGSRYALGELVTGGKKYRLYFVTREAEGKQKVFLFQIMER
ncbi:MAG: DUF4783 domain-containing protein [Bacteroidales bacterium]|nr:DUF4783 domain-containing protein [Bacteroidales bacterium]